jgi:hypothetical protein
VSPSALARALGRRGGRSRARRLSAADRRRIAAIGGRARRASLEAAARIADNFRYVASARELAPAPPVRRLRTSRSKLPGLYTAR